MPEFPVQLNKVQPPPLRDQTLARDRLLDWLTAKIHDRVVLVIAEAGYGKTTLLADFSRRTRLRTLWYRLDRGDRDWVGFIAHLAAAVRVHSPEFGPATAGLLRETATTAPSLDTVLDTFLRELGNLPADATVLILDDFHIVDDSPEIRHIVRELLARAPERLTFVFASRQIPPVPLARLRALGEVAELRTDDLRFDEAETERLFRETYEMPLEQGLIAELSRRTEGWAASLQLVRAALHDRDAVQTRAFIGSLSGAEGHLYDYLAEEVIGDLSPELQDFLMRTSILETIDLELGPIAAGISAVQARDFMAESERLGLVSRRGLHGRTHVRAHPLVREFLQARLRRAIGESAERELHREVATAAEPRDWFLAASHYIAAGDEQAADRIVQSSIDQILSRGAYTSAEAIERSLPSKERPDATRLILASRVAMHNGNPRLGVELAEMALREDPNSTAAALTVISARSFAGDAAGAVAEGRRLENSENPKASRLARAFRASLEASVEGSLEDALRLLEGLRENLAEATDDHFLGVALLCEANLRIPQGDAEGGLASAESAALYLERSSGGVELTSARVMRAFALAVLARVAESRREWRRALEESAGGQRLEVAAEAASMETLLGDEDVAAHLLEAAADEIKAGSDMAEQAMLARAFLHVRRGDAVAASQDAKGVPPRRLRTTVAFEAQRLLALGLAADLSGDSELGRVHLTEASVRALDQRAHLWAAVTALALSLLDRGSDPSVLVVTTSVVHPPALSIVAEAVLGRFDALNADARVAVEMEARRRPERWLPSIRRVVDVLGAGSNKAANLLEAIGAAEDVRRLRTYAKASRNGEGLGRELARRVAARVVVEDLGRVRVHVGDRVVEGPMIRRKVLALLCLLLSKERFSAAREEVLDALWPELDPASALNSLNQTVYFLRRVFEPAYREDESPGYLRQDAETIWLDGGLVEARSRQCRDLIRKSSDDEDPNSVLELANLYVGQFALDFAYEEWASTYRDSLHASYLRVTEQGIRRHMSLSQFTRAIALAERAVDVEPESEDIQVALIKLYRFAGAHAAASEQYGHYSRSLRGLGIDAPTFEAVVSDGA